MTITPDPAVIELAKTWVIDQVQQAAAAGQTLEEQMPVIVRLAEAIVGDSRALLVEWGEASQERIAAHRASLAVTKRQGEEQCKQSAAVVDAALGVLRPPNRTAHRKR